ncbi:hypothetical protein EIP91_005508 [Steccherinum ochraceum]|uniref:Protein kinase domain-containing protein n=1 Tax=Steccherinum ochraceum TaxID=92696 RepID=A0A4R0RWR4_9APHY|nr:hypothetical protein EIP91_005508 [Steccherinum ochraceum]
MVLSLQISHSSTHYANFPTRKMFTRSFNSLRKRNNGSDGEGGGSIREQTSHSDWPVRLSGRTSRRSSETPEQKVTRMIRASLETDIYTEVLDLGEQEGRLASRIVHEMLQPATDQASNQSKRFDVETRNKLLVLSWKLDLKHDSIPEDLFLHGVVCKDNESRSSWGISDIFRGEHRENKVALKRLRYHTKLPEAKKKELKQACYEESLLWRTLVHKHILPFLGVSTTAFGQTPCIVLPWMKNGDILHFMDVLKVQGKFEGPELAITVNQWLYEIAQGIEYLHDEGIVHGDLRGINVLIDPDLVACVSNFDLAVIPGTLPLDDTPIQLGPIRWRSPELLECEDLLGASPLTFASDIYSFACIVVELYTGQFPYAELTLDTQVFFKILEGYRPSRPHISENTDMREDLWALVTQCWAQQSSDRPPISDVVKAMESMCPKTHLPETLFLEGVKCLESESIASGAFADIYIGEYEGMKVALKRLKLYKKTEEWKKLRAKRSFFSESLIWSELKHKNILPFLGVDATNFSHNLCMVLPWMEHGSIRDCISELRSSNRFHNGVIRVTTWLSEIADGLAYLHSRQYVHGDLRGANILIDEDLTVRLADFGLAVVAQPTTGSYRSSSNGAIRWLAPELLDPSLFGYETSRPTAPGDVYAYACVCMEVHTCIDPFPGLTDYAVVKRIVEGKRPDRPSADKNELPISDALWDLCRRCWMEKPEDRPLAQTLVDELKFEMERLGGGMKNLESCTI